MFAGLGVVIGLAMLGVILSVLSYWNALSQIAEMQLDPSDREMLEGFAAMLFWISIVMVVVGTFSIEFPIMVALSFAVLVLSIIASNTVNSWGPWFASLRKRYGGIQ